MAFVIIQFVWLLHLQLPFFISAQNATLGDSKSTLGNNPYWKSPSGEFAFGFQRVDERGDLFLLAIWFDKIPERTIVWTANNGTPVEKRSTVELTLDGVLSLNGPNNEILWTRQPSSGGEVAGAAMLDTGNFVIFSNDFKILWESFKEPTDTILPTQRLDPGDALKSRQSKDDYKDGKFRFTLQQDRNLVLYVLASPTARSNAPYWASHTVDHGSQLIFNQSGYIYLALLDGNQTILTNVVPLSTRDYYQRATLDFDGVFRQYTYPKSSRTRSNQSWSIVRFLPDDICSADFGDVESGICGFNTYCKMEGGYPTCQCPPGYNYFDPKDTFGGCKQNFLPQSCNTDRLRVEDGYKMQKIPNVDWPYHDYRLYKNVALEECSNTCLKDCLCAISISRDGNCWLKRSPVSNGNFNPKYTVQSLTALIKVSNTTLNSPPPGLGFGGDKKHKDKWLVLVLILLGTSVFLNLVCLLLIRPFVYFLYHKKQFKTMPHKSTYGMDLRSFTYKELEEATDGFKEEVGQGAFSTVYKGSLRNVTGSFVAVKRLDRVARESEKEFKAEVNAIGMTNHKNLVKLLGYCEEGNNRLLVYEYMKNGSLADHLFGSSRPEWNFRVQVVFGIARGIAYLHGDISSQIIHCDVKPQNILLDDFFMAKISDFGLAKLLNADQTRTNTGIRGTRGYVAPEWFKNMAITAKVDVYSFGILLLEIITCRKNAKVEMGAEEIDILSEWVYECCELKDFHRLVLNDEEAKNDGKTLERLLIVALWCIQENPSQRPSMKKVIQMLEGAVEVSMPPKPSFLSSIG